MTDLISILDQHMLYAGPCAMCGGSDKRHRVLDAMADCIAAGNPVELVAEDYGYDIEFVRVVGEQWPRNDETTEANRCLCAENETLREALRDLLAVAGSMPDAGLTGDDPRSTWWFGPLFTARERARRVLAAEA